MQNNKQKANAGSPQKSGGNAGLYLHIPFCQAKCEYCDFYSITQLDQIKQFVDALIKEIELRSPNFQEIAFDTVFFGGGTPSLLNESQLERIWETLFQHFQINPNGEFSIESNPGTLEYSKLAHFRSLGFNRLSMGVQSFNPSELKFLGRIHTVEQVFENFKNARKAGFENINIDLMTAFPEITEHSFLESLHQALKLKSEHISCYTLIFEPGTVFYKRMLRGEMQPLSEDEEAIYYEIVARELESHGYQQYEISNFARNPENVCRHNLIYWKHQPYIGFGPSAHSFLGNARFANRRSLAAYIKLLSNNNLPVDFREELTEAELMFEYTFLRLRLKEGLNLGDFYQRFGIEFNDVYDSTIRQLTENGLVYQQDDRLRLSSKGWLVADTVATYF